MDPLIGKRVQVRTPTYGAQIPVTHQGVVTEHTETWICLDDRKWLNLRHVLIIATEDQS